MKYRLVYDVLQDGFPWVGVVFTVIPLLFAIACLLVIAERARGKSPVPGPRVPGRIPLEETPLGLVVLFMLGLGAIGVFLASLSYQGFRQRQRCQEWARTGQYQVTEGKVADYQHRKAGAFFRVADASFELLNRSAGFTGRFNSPGAESGSLREGLQVRLAHQDGFILRVEVGQVAAD